MESAVNRYASLALEHWQRHRADELARMQDRESFFAQLGEQISYQIAELARELCRGGPPDELYLAKANRFRDARQLAEDEVLRHVLPTPTRPEPIA
jgi:hypothetical protein